jgi:hypothetical protein
MLKNYYFFLILEFLINYLRSTFLFTKIELDF